MRNKHFLLLPLVFIFSFITAEAQMNTDNSYLRKNYLQSKTAKKAAAKKARKKELKQIRLASKKKRQTPSTAQRTLHSETVHISRGKYLQQQKV